MKIHNYIKKGNLVYNLNNLYLYKRENYKTTNNYNYNGLKLFLKIDNKTFIDITDKLQTDKKYGYRMDKEDKATIVYNKEDELQWLSLTIKDVKVLDLYLNSK